MRAILIDPETKTFTEIQIADDIDGIQKVLRCGRFTTGGRPLRGSLSTGFDTLYVSDDSLEDREGPRFWFQVDADRDPPSSYPIAGPGLAYGIDSNGAGGSLNRMCLRRRHQRCRASIAHHVHAVEIPRLPPDPDRIIRFSEPREP